MYGFASSLSYRTRVLFPTDSFGIVPNGPVLAVKCRAIVKESIETGIGVPPNSGGTPIVVQNKSFQVAYALQAPA
jgi:hypothetical protein